jgi:hypothetical protein
MGMSDGAMGSKIATRSVAGGLAIRPQITRTITAPTTAPIRPAPSSARYQPIACPRYVATKAPTIPRMVVRMKPDGSLSPGVMNSRSRGDEPDNDRPDDAHGHPPCLNLGSQRSLDAPTSVVWNLQKITTCLAMHSIRIVALQRALRASVIYLRWPEDRLPNAHEQGDADNHGGDRCEFTPNPRQDDITKPCCCDRSYGEVKRIDVPRQPSRRSKKECIDKAGYDEEEGHQIDDGVHRVAPFGSAS